MCNRNAVIEAKLLMLNAASFWNGYNSISVKGYLPEIVKILFFFLVQLNILTHLTNFCYITSLSKSKGTGAFLYLQYLLHSSTFPLS